MFIAKALPPHGLQETTSMFSHRCLGSTEHGIKTGSQFSAWRRLQEVDTQGGDLNLRHCGFGPTAAATIAEFIHKRAGIKRCDLEENRMEDAGVCVLAEAMQNTIRGSLEVLNLQHNNVRRAGAVGMARVLRMAKSAALQELYLSHNGIDDSGVKSMAEALCGNTTLRVLHLSSNPFGDVGAEGLAKALDCNVTLQELALSYCRIRGPGVVAIAKAIADDMAEEEDDGERSGLTSLDLSWNNLQVSGAAGLGQSLATNESMRSLKLAHCNLKPDGAVCISEGMRSNCHLTALDLSWNPISDEGLSNLMAALQQNGTVTELGIENIQAGVKQEELSFDPRHAGGPHRLDLSVTYDRWVAKMLKSQALKNPGDSWKNVTLDGRWFDIHGMTEEWGIPEKGILELEYCPSEVALNRRVKHDFDLKVEHDKSTALRLRERMLLVPEEMWENVTWNGAKVKPAMNGTWRVPDAGNLTLEHIVLEQQPGAIHNLSFKIDLMHQQDRSLMQAIMTRMEVEKGVTIKNITINGREYDAELLREGIPPKGQLECRYQVKNQRYEASYFLDLSNQRDRALAIRLRERAVHEPGENWVNERVNGVPFVLDEQNEHWKIPLSGILELDYKTTRPSQMVLQHVELDLEDKWDYSIAEAFLERAYLEACPSHCRVWLG